MKTTRSTSRHYELLGWVIFIFSAIFFISSSIRAGDLLSLIGGVLFLLACIVFLIPLLNREAHSTHSDNLED